MKACQAYQESLLLDVYGELEFKERAAWERHLEDCPGCREERRNMLRFLGYIKESAPAPDLSPDKADALSRAVRTRLSGGEAGLGRRDRIVSLPTRTLAAVAAACCIVVLSGWLALKWFETPSHDPGSTDQIQVSQKDLEVISNLELLEELETLRKLVHVIDHNDTMFGRPQI